METREKLCITVKEAAEMLGIGVGTMYEVAHRADFPSLQLGTKRIVIPRQAFIDWVYRSATKDIIERTRENA